jgi:antibiotic biosynthesis monooxygenase (ABM) superfamily enzyme
MKAPAKHKMALLIWITIYPTLNLLFWLLGKPLEAFPIYVKTLVMTLILVPLMVYFFLPFLTKTFHKWLTK